MGSQHGADRLVPATIAMAVASIFFSVSSPAPAAETAFLQPAAMGCGAGRNRDEAGKCRRSFNLFDHHERRRFHRFRRDHCVRVETPNGRVRRCRI